MKCPLCKKEIDHLQCNLAERYELTINAKGQVDYQATGDSELLDVWCPECAETISKNGVEYAFKRCGVEVK